MSLAEPASPASRCLSRAEASRRPHPSGGLTEGEAGVNLEKFGQMRAYGATVLCPEASMLTLTRLAATLTAELGWIWMRDLPAYQAEGDRTTAFEIAEQLGWDTPDYVLVPAGTGTNLFGIWKGFDELCRRGFTARVPRIVAGPAGRRRSSGSGPRPRGCNHAAARQGPSERRAPHHSPGHRPPCVRSRPEEPRDRRRRDRCRDPAGAPGPRRPGGNLLRAGLRRGPRRRAEARHDGSPRYREPRRVHPHEPRSQGRPRHRQLVRRAGSDRGDAGRGPTRRGG